MCFIAQEDLLDTQDIGAILSEKVNLITKSAKIIVFVFCDVSENVLFRFLVYQC